ncbi:MAG: cbb3-type cytochrome c oxidase subunit I [Terriglobales bacterium]
MTPIIKTIPPEQWRPLGIPTSRSLDIFANLQILVTLPKSFERPGVGHLCQFAALAIAIVFSVPLCISFHFSAISGTSLIFPQIMGTGTRERAMTASASTVQQHLQEIWETPKTVYGWFPTVDHKEIGHRYLATAFIFLILGGVEALIMRIQLARSDQSWLTPETYNELFTMHGMTMIFWYAAPILSGFANYLIPLMIGARDMAFPRLNAFSYWTFLLSGVLLYVSAFMGESPHGGWFAYVPYTSIRYSPGFGMDLLGVEPVPILCSLEGRGPATLGICNPVLVLPEWFFSKASEDELSSTLGHELAHVRRHDFILNLAYEILMLPLCFHPAAALIKNRIDQTREFACDEIAAESLPTGTQYARSLLRIAQSMASKQRPTTVGYALGLFDTNTLGIAS